MTKQYTLPSIVLPSAPTVEAEIISSCVIDPNLLSDYDLASIPPEAFRSEKNRVIWRHITRLYWDDEAIDLPNVVESMRQAAELDKAGGINYLVGLMSESLGVGTNAASYARQLIDVHRRNVIIEASLKAASAAAKNPDYLTTLTQLEKDLSEVGDVTSGTSDSNAFELAEAIMSNQGSVLSGYDSLDRAIGGFPRGDLTILAGRTSIGKSSFLHGCAFASKNCLVLTPDQPKPEIFAAEASRRCGIPLNVLRSGSATQDQLDAWQDALESVRQDVVVNRYTTFRDGPLTLESMTRAVKRGAEQGRELIFVDHLQRIRSDMRSQERRQLMVELTGTLKDLSREYGIAVVAASQLKRDIDERQDKRPMLSDLSESKSIEEDANLVLFLYRDKYYNPNSEMGDVADIIIAKHKTSERLRVVNMLYEGKLIRFKEIA